ncbi:MAG: hypothetical protein JO142_10295, partial [Burkholderiales bacterium]|nr:hypothetical protein [Burkholderiales bacterium]
NAQYQNDPSASPTGEDISARSERLQLFSANLAQTRDRWIKARAATGWDRQVQTDIDNYEGRDAANRMAANMMLSVEQGFPITTREAKPQRSTVFVQVTRQKTNSAEARLADILLPTDDRNFGISPTPDPECAHALNDHGSLIDPVTGQPVLMDAAGNVTTADQGGQPVPKSKIAQAVQHYAEKCAEAMQTKIDDQLEKCDYNAEVRKMIHNAAKMGTGVLKGPMVTKRVRKAWVQRQDETGTVRALEIVEELAPASVSVDPRKVWEDPACGDDVKNGQGIFELDTMTGRQVRELAKQPGYLLDQLREVLTEGPVHSAALNETRQAIEDREAEPEKIFQRWIYWGELDREDLGAAGVDLGGAEDDVLTSYCGCVEMINNRVVRAYLNPLDDHPVPYEMFPWEKIAGSPRGHGIPRLMRAQQNVINAAWRQLMDNSGVTSGPQIVVNQQAVTPADGQWTLSPRKFWWVNDTNQQVQNVFASVEFNNHQQELQAIIELAEKLSDQETGVPQMMSGEKGTSPDTVGGMQMLMNSGNVVLRRLVKQFDDLVTRPHIRRYYDYNMQYSDDEEIKGDFTIEARGSSALVIRDIQNQAMVNLLNTAGNPVFAPMIDTRALFEKALQAQHIDPADIMLTPEQVQANAQAHAPQPDPRVQAAMINAQARMKEAGLEAQAKQSQVEARAQAEVEDRQLRVQELMLQRDIEILKTSSAERISINEIKAQLAEL